MASRPATRFGDSEFGGFTTGMRPVACCGAIPVTTGEAMVSSAFARRGECGWHIRPLDLLVCQQISRRRQPRRDADRSNAGHRGGVGACPGRTVRDQSGGPAAAAAPLRSTGIRPRIAACAALEYAPNLDRLIYYSALDGPTIRMIAAPKGAGWSALVAANGVGHAARTTDWTQSQMPGPARVTRGTGGTRLGGSVLPAGVRSTWRCCQACRYPGLCHAAQLRGCGSTIDSIERPSKRASLHAFQANVRIRGYREIPGSRGQPLDPRSRGRRRATSRVRVRPPADCPYRTL